MSTKYTNVGQSGGAIVGTTVADTEKKYSNTGSAVYGTGNNVTPADLGFSDDVTELWMRFDYYVSKTKSNLIKIKFYFDHVGDYGYIGLYGDGVCYNAEGNSYGGINGSLFNKQINKVVFHISTTALQIYINDVVAFDKTDINNGSKITRMNFMSEQFTDSTTANNNMFSNVIIADYDCSNETLESNSTTISTNETINADVLRKINTDVILNADISSSLKVDKIGLVFDGTTSSLQLPLSVSAGKKVWTISTTLTTNQNTFSPYNYHQPCLMGIDTGGYNSDDFHIDTSNGNLYLFNGMGDVYRDIGTDTGIKINDEIQHNIVLTSDGSKFVLYCDGVKATESAITKALHSDYPITIGCSKPGEQVYSQLTLYDFKFYDVCLADGKATTEKPIVDYEPDTTDFSNKYLADKSGNGNNSQAFQGTITSVSASAITSAETLNIDIARKVSAELVNVYDIARILKDNTIAETINADISRKTNIDELADYDLEKSTANNINLSVDVQCITSNNYTVTEDIVRNIVYGATLEVDTKRTKNLATVDNADTRISIPSVITDQSSGLQSVSISMGQSQLSDSIRIVTINPVDINGAVIGNFLDYKLNMRAETTSQKGILQEITCMTDKDEILYKKIVYTGDDDDDSTVKIYHEKRIYDETVVNNKSELLSYMKLSMHLKKIANVLGCNLVMCSDDYISTCSLNDSGATYQSIISELCGWTSKLPNMFINAFLRGNTLYIIQRGHEPNEINIDNLKMTEPTIAKKLIRTEWNNPQSTNSDNSKDNNKDKNKDKDDGDDSDVDKQEPRVETSSDTRYSDDGGYSVTETQRNYEEIGALNGAVMISHETEKCTAYSAENPPSTSVEGGVEVYRGASRDITVTLTETYHNYDSCGWHTVTTTTTVDGILKETHTSKSLGSTEGVTPFRVHAANDAKKKSDAIGTDDSNSLIDSDFPVYGDYLTTCKSNIKWLNRKVQETVTLSIYDYTHIFDFQDKIVYKGNTYSIQSSSFEKNSTIVNKQDLVLIRFY